MPNYSCVSAIHPTVEFLVVNIGFYLQLWCWITLVCLPSFLPSIVFKRFMYKKSAIVILNPTLEFHGVYVPNICIEMWYRVTRLRLLSCELLLGDKILPCNILGAGFDTWEGGKSVPQIRLLVFFRGSSFVLVIDGCLPAISHWNFLRFMYQLIATVIWSFIHLLFWMV